MPRSSTDREGLGVAVMLVKLQHLENRVLGRRMARFCGSSRAQSAVGVSTEALQALKWLTMRLTENFWKFAKTFRPKNRKTARGRGPT